MKLKKPVKGFTFVETIVFIFLIIILVFIVVLAILPGKQISENRNAQRKEDVNSILNAVYQYKINTSMIPDNITSIPTEVCATGGVCTGLVDLSEITDDGEYLSLIPEEPLKVNIYGAGYLISRSTNGRITVEAQYEEDGEVIFVTR